MIDREEWLKKGRGAIIDLCQVYSAYVTGYRDSYTDAVNEDNEPANVAWTLSMSAYFDMFFMEVNAGKLNRIYERSPGLESSDILGEKLNGMSDIEILWLLSLYNAYIISLDEICTGNCPVCLDEYLENDFRYGLLEMVRERFERQLEFFIGERISEGVQAMREEGMRSITDLALFGTELNQLYEQLDPDDADDMNTVEALAALSRDGSLLQNVLAWCKSRNVPGAVHCGVYAFEEYWKYAIKSAGL